MSDPQVYGKRQTPLGLLSIDSKLLYDRLRQVESCDEIVTYQELSALINRDVQDAGRHLLATAREKMLREHDVAFGVIRDIGLKRLDSRDRVNTGPGVIEHIHRSAKKGARTIGVVDPALAPDLRSRGYAFLGLLGSLALFTDSRNVALVEAATEKEQAQLPQSEMLRLFAE